MKTVSYYFGFLLIVGMLLVSFASCKKDELSKTDLLCKQWHVDSFYWLYNGTRTEDQLGFDQIFTFKPDGTLIEKIIFQGDESYTNGQWHFTNNEQNMDVINEHGTVNWIIQKLTESEFIIISDGYYEMDMKLYTEK